LTLVPLLSFGKVKGKGAGTFTNGTETIYHSDLRALYWINVFMIDGTEQTAKLIENIDEDYTEPVDFGKIFQQLPPLTTVF
jgi:hypothetical protein